MRQKKRLLSAVALVASLGLVAAACGSDDEETSSDTTAATAEEGTDTTAAPAAEETSAEAPAEGGNTVGLLFDITGRGDKSFNDAAAAGLDQATEELGIAPSESTPTGDSDRADRLNLLVSEGNELVIGVGFLWTDAVNAAP